MVSEHLAALRDAGLVHAERQGRAVFHRRTALAATLAADAPPSAR